MKERCCLYVIMLVFVSMISTEASAEKRAFIVGIKSYLSGLTLDNGVRDAALVKNQLSKFGYEISVVADGDATREKILSKWEKFVSSVKRGDDIVVYFSGHGIAVAGANYLVTKEADPDKITPASDPRSVFIPFSRLVNDLSEKRVNAAVWILDACRSNQLKIGLPKGLATGEKMGQRHEVLYSASDGQEAQSDVADGASLYTKYLVLGMKSLGKNSVEELASNVQKKVYELNPTQIPAIYGSLPTFWCFNGCDPNLLKNIIFETDTKSVQKPTTLALAQTKSLSPRERRQNAVFLGKKSTTKNCASEPDYKHPFGCLLLNDVAQGNARKYIGSEITAAIDVNVRRRPPIVKDKFQFFCIIDVLRRGDIAKTTAVVSFVYAGETYYWATLSNRRESCAGGEIAKL